LDLSAHVRPSTWGVRGISPRQPPSDAARFCRRTTRAKPFFGLAERAPSLPLGSPPLPPQKDTPSFLSTPRATQPASAAEGRAVFERARFRRRRTLLRAPYTPPAP
jgi:hypothetical protein